MPNMLKQILAFPLCFAMLFTSVFLQSVSAAPATSHIQLQGENYQVVVLRDNATTRLVKVSNGDESILARYNKHTGSMRIIQNGKQLEIDTNLNRAFIENPINHGETIQPSEPVVADEVTKPIYANAIAAPNTTLIESKCNFFSSYCYWVTKKGTTYTWKLTTPEGSKTVYETSSNTGELHNFRSKTVEMKQKEIEIVGVTSSAGLSGIVTLLAGAPASGGMTAIIAFLVAFGVGATVSVIGAQLYFIRNDAIYHFRRV